MIQVLHKLELMLSGMKMEENTVMIMDNLARVDMLFSLRKVHIKLMLMSAFTLKLWDLESHLSTRLYMGYGVLKIRALHSVISGEEQRTCQLIRMFFGLFPKLLPSED